MGRLTKEDIAVYVTAIALSCDGIVGGIIEIAETNGTNPYEGLEKLFEDMRKLMGKELAAQAPKLGGLN